MTPQQKTYLTALEYLCRTYQEEGGNPNQPGDFQDAVILIYSDDKLAQKTGLDLPGALALKQQLLTDGLIRDLGQFYNCPGFQRTDLGWAYTALARAGIALSAEQVFCKTLTISQPGPWTGDRISMQRALLALTAVAYSQTTDGGASFTLTA